MPYVDLDRYIIYICIYIEIHEILKYPTNLTGYVFGNRWGADSSNDIDPSTVICTRRPKVLIYPINRLVLNNCIASRKHELYHF